MALNVRPLKDVSNADILNAIRKNATRDYQARIPEATKARQSDTIDGLLNYRPARNEFVDALVNQIGLIVARNISWTNPLAPFKRGMLSSGNTIEEIQTGLLEAKSYNHDRDYMEKDIWGQETPDVQSSFHTINREDYYKITVKDFALRRALTTEEGLNQFITQLMAVPSTSDQWDEFLLTVNLFSEFERNDGFFKAHIPDIAGASDANIQGAARSALRKFREFGDLLKFPSRHYNPAGMPTFAQPDELVLFVTPAVNAAVDVDALSAAFNIDRSASPFSTTVVPDFGIDGVQAILTTRDFFVMADTLFETTSAANPVGLYNNYFLHHHEIVSASRFVPAIAFTSLTGDVITLVDPPVTGVSAITVQDAEGDTVTAVSRAALFQVNVAATTTGDNSAVKLALIGAASPRTYLTQQGVLHVAADESSEALTIKATATDDETFSASVELDVTGEIARLWPDPAVLADGV